MLGHQKGRKISIPHVGSFVNLEAGHLSIHMLPSYFRPKAIISVAAW